MIIRILEAAAVLFFGFLFAFAVYYFVSSIVLSFSFMSAEEKKETLRKLAAGEWKESDDDQ